MAKCPGCGSEMAPNARFCSLCGRDVTQTGTGAPAAAPNPTTQIPTQYANPSVPGGAGPAVPNRTPLYIGGALAALAIIALLVAKAAGVFSGAKAEPTASGVLTAPPTRVAAAPILTPPSVAAPTPAPVLQAPQTKGNPMPADVIDYLRWLKQFDSGRQQLESKGQAQLTLLLQDFMKEYMTGQSLGLLNGDAADTSPQQPKGLDITPINQVIQDWNTAAGIFSQKTPPNPCATLATDYRGALTTAVQQMTQITGMFVQADQSIKNAGGEKTTNAQQTLTTLFQEKNSQQMSQSVEGSYSSANQALDAVRDQYTDIPPDIDKSHFTIKVENGGSVQLPGLPM